MMKKYFMITLVFGLYYSITNAQFTGTFPGGASQQFCAGNVTVGNHLTFNSNAGVINWGGGGSGDLYFRRLNTQGNYGSGFNNLMIIRATGDVGIGTILPNARLHVVGGYALFSSAANPTTAALIRGNNGFSTPTTPDYTWYGSGGNDQTGIYHPSTNTIGFSTGGSEKMTITNDNVVFGNLSNAYFNAAIGRAPNLDYGNMYLGFNVVHNEATNKWRRETNSAGNGGSLIWGSANGQLSFAALPMYGTAPIEIDDSQVQSYRVMRMRYVINTGPQVMIGEHMPGNHMDFMLSVDGKMVAHSLFITQQAWADYVFDEDYKLMSLDSLENYINDNNHLPNVPTTEEVLENGNNTGETDRILLEKIEELSLYIIQLNKRIEELENK